MFISINVRFNSDQYISFFVKNPDRKAPEINRGYYARVKGVEMCIERFLKVINLVFRSSCTQDTHT